MEITNLGHSSFKIRGKNITLVTDPYSDEMLSFKFPKVEADIVTISHNHKDHNQVEKIAGQPFLINAPGEYEVKGVSIFGLPTFHDAKLGRERGTNICYLIEMDGLRICHLGDLGQILSGEQLEELDGIDLLFLPVGGVFTISPKEAVEMMTKIEPRIVVPMHFRAQGINLERFGQLLPVEAFLKEAGVEARFEPKLSINQDNLPEERQIVVLERRE